MEIVKTPFEGLIEIRRKKHVDDRGWFTEFFNSRDLQKSGANLPAFTQDNLSFSKKGVVRGLHLQLAPLGQAKFVSVVMGKVVDVVVDLRKGSPTFGQSFQLELDGENQNALFIPEGFAHGFAALTDSFFMYKCSSFYEPTAESGIRWNDSDLNIRWPFENPIVSAKDGQLPTLRELMGKSLISQHA